MASDVAAEPTRGVPLDSAAGAAPVNAPMTTKGLNAHAAAFQPGSLGWEATDAGEGKDNEEEGWEPYMAYLRGGFYNEELGWWMPYYFGKLKSFNMRTGYGFLECKQTHDIYRTDVYIHKSQMVMPFTVGQPVEFAVTQNARGQPQASDVQWIPANLPRRQKAAKPSQSSPAAAQGGSGSSSSRHRHMGMLKSYSAQQGYGFIQSDDISEKHSCDVYLDRGQLPPSGEWRPGCIVEFEVSYNHRGQPQAKAVNWDPVPMLPRSADPARGANQTGMGLGGAAKTEGVQGMRNLNKLQAFFRNSDVASAVRTALELQRNAESNDYVSFVLDRLGTPEQACQTLGAAVQLNLLIGVSELLAKSAFPAERTKILLAWCEAIVPSLSPADGTSEDLQFDNVINLVQDHLKKAKALALQKEDTASGINTGTDSSSADAAFTQVLDLLQKATSTSH